ncbi:MAG: 16S rRNA (cytidine(1402)-2'-O)-methyltransferase [Armatimonadota bacterium]|nr:16S rRNA (cytidine(1402)-2'-O)-methyltransferase [Armatimonadota bacterium]
MTGKLYVVGTPIGNLEDITLRALRILQEVDLIACEDTRRTRNLLARYNLSKPLVSYHEHNERERAGELLSRLRSGESIALLTDAGMPAISDPGSVLIQAAIAEGIPVIPIPGPSAVTTALVVSGLPTDRYTFAGFLPRKRSERRAVLQSLQGLPGSLVFFEAPHRLIQTLRDLLEVLGDRRIAVARELTKVHEEVLRGRISEVLARLEQGPVRGEVTLVVEGSTGQREPNRWAAQEHLAQLLLAGVPPKEAVRQVARAYGLPRREVFAWAVGYRKPKCEEDGNEVP